MVEHILNTEENWNSWKNEGCPSFVKERASDTKPTRVVWKRAAPEDFLGKGPNKKILIGNEELTRLWNLCPDNMEACKSETREYMPTLEEFFEEAIEQADPENMVESEYKTVNNSNYGWRALRLLARRSPHFFQPTNQQFKSLPEYLENMVIKLAKELPPPSEEIKTGEDEDEEDNDALLKENESPDVRQDKPITGEQIELFANKLGEQWKILAPYLEIKDSEMRQIESDSEDMKMRAKQLLVKENDTVFSSPSRSSMAFPKKKLRGLVAATLTPMTENGEINFPVIGQYVDYLVKEQGVKNIFVNGTTGEGLSLSVSERRQVAAEWVTQGRNKLDQVVIHVGALSVKESQELAQHAAEIGADGIAVIAPFFFKSQSKDALISFLREVAAAAPALPFYYYHIPSLTGVKIRAEELLDGIREKIPSFQGLKFSDTDLLDFGQCVDQNQQRQFALLFGVDEQLLSGLIMGANGAVGSTYNYLGKKTNQMLEAFEQKDFTSALNYQFCIQRFINHVIKLGFGVSQTKAIMTLVSGIPMGPPRLPLQKATQEFTAKAEAKLKSLDFLPFPGLREGNVGACS
ncbi:N-acetylneuraminate lyase [Microtus ochrogaster]|uniref:N-acetylneuraminate lyase n=1 Tax=Microtus ochrogaster TaxID=79684 RepID=A0A8J6G3H2_MICOH|nr:N-acetylneuraminate lyase [Microtus ochrogaster]